MYTERDADRFNSSTITMYCTRSSTGPQEPQAPLPSLAPFGTPHSCLTHQPALHQPALVLRHPRRRRCRQYRSHLQHRLCLRARPAHAPALHHHHPFPTPTTPHATKGEEAELADASLLWIAVGAGGVVSISCRRAQVQGEKDPDRPIYKIYVNNAYIQEEDGGIKVLSNGKIVDDKEPSQVQDWVNSLFKYGPSPPAGDEAAEANVTMNSAEPLTVECKRGPSVKYASPARFGVLTNGSIMREPPCPSSSSSSSSKPQEDAANEDFKYRDLSETTSNSTTDSTASTFTAKADLPPPPPPPPLMETSLTVRNSAIKTTTAISTSSLNLRLRRRLTHTCNLAIRSSPYNLESTNWN